MRLCVVYDRLAEFAEVFLEKNGWTDDFGEFVGAYQQAQVELAITTPGGQEMPNPTAGELLLGRRG